MLAILTTSLYILFHPLTYIGFLYTALYERHCSLHMFPVNENIYCKWIMCKCTFISGWGQQQNILKDVHALWSLCKEKQEVLSVTLGVLTAPRMDVISVDTADTNMPNSVWVSAFKCGKRLTWSSTWIRKVNWFFTFTHIHLCGLKSSKITEFSVLCGEEVLFSLLVTSSNLVSHLHKVVGQIKIKLK